MNDNKLQEFVASLGSYNSGWQECSVKISSDILAEFSDAEWIKLLAAIDNRPAYWQERCAEAIGMSEISNGIQVLFSLVYSASMQVSAIAASELDNLCVCVPIRYRARLEALLLYLKAQKSPRSEDVQRLLSQCK